MVTLAEFSCLFTRCMYVNLSLCPCHVMFDTCKIKRFDYFDLDLKSRLYDPTF